MTPSANPSAPSLPRPPAAVPTLGLYVHFPWCVAKCPYCDFRSYPTREVPEGAYLDHLLLELARWRQWLGEDPRPLTSIYLGGGTPSLFSPAAVERLLGAVADQWSLAPGVEITLEANPESAPVERLAGFRRAGVNRLSIGLQALTDQRLRLLGRPHDRKQGVAAVAAARRAGFGNLSLDLIYATPGHTREGWGAELAEVVALAPEHLSCYHLSYEPETRFHQRLLAGQLAELPEEEQLALFRQTREGLARAGYPPYEISNFAPPARAGRHNLNIWRFGDYIGLGCAAHGKLTGADGRVLRSANPATPEAYLARVAAGRHPAGEREHPDREELAGECVLMGLRLTEGMDRATCAAAAGGVDLLQRRGVEVERLLAGGLLTVTPQRVVLTEAGVVLANGVMAALM